jgi:hypothetical protein
MDMDDVIENLRGTLPEAVRTRLDLSPESLDVIEQIALDKYEQFADAFRSVADVAVIDAMGRYVGEVFRKHLGGRWMISYEDPQNIFYGLPQVSGMIGQTVQMCPYNCVTDALDRRMGSFIRSIFDSCSSRD